MIETSRLLIRPWTLDDIPHYQAMSKDIGYTCFSPPGVFLVKDDEGALEQVKTRIKLFEEHQIGKFLVLEKSSGSFVGTCGGNFFDLEGKLEVELGYRMMLEHWGKGFATEAASASVVYLLNVVNLKSVYGFALPQNQQSLKILEKIGMKYQKDFSWANLPHKLYKSEKQSGIEIQV